MSDDLAVELRRLCEEKLAKCRRVLENGPTEGTRFYYEGQADAFEIVLAWLLSEKGGELNDKA